jgi:hypothetical protein
MSEEFLNPRSLGESSPNFTESSSSNNGLIIREVVLSINSLIYDILVAL